MSYILETKDLKKYYGQEPNVTKALDGVSVAVEQGEFVSIIGTSGSGKSTLLNMLGGLDIPTSGSVRIRKKEIAKMDDEQLTVFRRRNIGFVFQDYNLVPILNVYQNIVLPIELDGNPVDREYVNRIISLLHLEEKAGEPSEQSLRRSAAESGDRKGAGGQTCDYPCRRADRKSGFQDIPGGDAASPDDKH